MLGHFAWHGVLPIVRYTFFEYPHTHRRAFSKHEQSARV
jgi:hypothetical protein